MTLTSTYIELLDEIERAYFNPKAFRKYAESALEFQYNCCSKYIFIRRKTTGKLLVIETCYTGNPELITKINPNTQHELSDFNESFFEEVEQQFAIPITNIVALHRPVRAAAASWCVELNISWDEVPDNQLFYSYFTNAILHLELNFYKDLKRNQLDLEPKKWGRLIRKIQSSLIAWSMDLVQLFHLERLTHSRSQKQQYLKQEIYYFAYNVLENCLVHLERHYSHYLDADQFVPVNIISSRIQRLKPKAEKLKVSLCLLNFSQDLNDLIYEPLLLLANVNPKNRITYHQLMFIECYVNRLTKLVKAKKQIDERTLHTVLIELNYNNQNYLLYLVNAMQKVLERQANLKEKLNTIHDFIRILNQTIETHGVAFCQKSKHIKHWLNEWLNEELYYTKSIQSLNHSQTTLSISDDTKPVEKIQMNCSVPELALLFRLLIENNWIHAANHRSLMDLISKTISTSRTNEVSSKSLSNKYYDVDPGTIDIVKGRLIEMLGRLKDL